MMAWYPLIPSLGSWREAAFAGYFGPIGVSAVYYAILAGNRLPETREHLKEVIYPVVLFLALTSTVAHGITIPVARFTPHIYRRTRSSVSLASDGATELLKSLRRVDGARTVLNNRRGFAIEDGLDTGAETGPGTGPEQSTVGGGRSGMHPSGMNSSGSDIGLRRMGQQELAV